ncbi:MAG: AAA family ATPase [Candidatus Methanoperedenaceae archaeon]|nr:AAA family ATPase [Candidatus Methanoperedenaceae archaeon]
MEYVKFTIKDRNEYLHGSFGVTLKTNSRDFQQKDIVEIINGNKTCGAIVSEVQIGNNEILMDEQLQNHIGAQFDTVIEIKKIILKNAKVAEISVPDDFSQSESLIRNVLMGMPISKGMRISIFTWGGKEKVIQIGETEPSGIVSLTASTQFLSVIKNQAVNSVQKIKFSDIGGLDREINRLKEVLIYPLNYPHIFDYLGIGPPKGIILYGPPGTGKTLLVKALINEIGANFHVIQGPEIMSKWFGESPRILRELFEKARDDAEKHNNFSVILIDEIDSITESRENDRGKPGQDIVATLLTLMDGIKGSSNIVVIGTTNRINSIDIALRRAGRFEREINIGVPNSEARMNILHIHTKNMPLSDNVDFNKIVRMTRGYVGADMASLCREAAYNALRKKYKNKELENKNQINLDELKEIKIQQSDFDMALPHVAPSLMRSFKDMIVENPDVSWDSIGGLYHIKKKFEENIKRSIENPELFKNLGISPIKSIFLYGAPGTGKSLLVKAAANECNASLILVKGTEIISKWIGESEKNIHSFFSRAREMAPCILFFDDIEATAQIRGEATNKVNDTIVNQMLLEMDEIEDVENVFVIAASNRPDIIDPSLLQSNRFGELIMVPVPDHEARLVIFKIATRKMRLSNDVNLNILSMDSEGYTGSDIEAICRKAGILALNEKRSEVSMEHLTKALNRTKRSATPELIQWYEKIREVFENERR